MLWSSSNKNTTSRPSEPTTPGLASWAFNSIFANKTPLSKYNELNQQNHYYPQGSSVPRNEENYDDLTDTFHNRRKNKQLNTHDNVNLLKSRNIENETITKNNNSNNTYDWRNDGKFGYSTAGGSTSRPKSSSFSKTSDTPSLKQYYKDKELLYGDDNDDRYSTHSNSKSTTPFRDDTKTSLPSYFPGKFPNERSDHANDSDLLRQAEINKEANIYNTRKNSSNREGFNQRSRDQPLDSKKSYSSILKNFKESDDYKSTLAGDFTSRQRPRSSDDTFRARSDRLKSHEDTHQRLKSEEIQTEILKTLDNNIEELDDICRNLQSINLKDEYFQLKKEHFDLKSKYLELEQELAEAIKTSNSACDQLSDIAERHRLLKQENKKLKDKLELLELDSRRGVSDLKKSSEDQTRLELKLNDKIAYLKENLETQSKQSIREQSRLQDTVFNLERKLETTESNLSEVNLRIKQLEEENRKLRSEQEGPFFTRVKQESRPASRTSSKDNYDWIDFNRSKDSDDTTRYLSNSNDLARARKYKENDTVDLINRRI